MRKIYFSSPPMTTFVISGSDQLCPSSESLHTDPTSGSVVVMAAPTLHKTDGDSGVVTSRAKYELPPLFSPNINTTLSPSAEDMVPFPFASLINVLGDASA